jgi:hypothetical protein
MKSKLYVIILIITLVMPNITFAMTLYVVVSDNFKGHSFSGAEIKRIFLGEVTMLGNQGINLIYPSYSSPAINTLSHFLGKGSGSRNLKSYWSKMIFTGRANPPQTANNDGELKQYLAHGNGIGVATSGAGMNVVYTING